MPRRYNVVDDINRFIELKLNEFTSGREDKVSIDEMNEYTQRIMEVWNSEIRKYPLETMSGEEKEELFKKVEIR